MTELISSENRDVIARELAARDVDDYTIEWGLEKIDRAARRFVDAKSRPRERRYGPQVLAEQIEKVKSLSGDAKDRAVRLAKQMGLDSEAIDLLASPQRTSTFREFAHNREILMRLDPQFFEEIAKRTCRATNRFQVTCIGVWLATGGEVRFSTNDRNDGGPFGRFLTAAFIDAYRASGVRMPTPDGIRKKITRLKSAVDEEGFDWAANFSPEIESDVENMDQLELIDAYFDLDD